MGRIYVYDGTSWRKSYESTEDGVRSLAVYNGKLYAGTSSDNLGYGNSHGNIYVYDGTSWRVSKNLPGDSLAVYSGKLYRGSLGSVGVYGDNQVLSSLRSSWDTNWHHVVTTFRSGSQMSIYIDGALDSSKSASAAIDKNNLALLLGKTYGSQMAGGTPEAFEGIIDEVRISSTARSAAWIKTEYNNQNSPSTFYSVGKESPPKGH